jgi:hypothetical protein
MNHNVLLYQIEVKLALVRGVFSPKAGWRVTVDIDGSEMGKGKQQPRGKGARARTALKEMQALGVTIGPDDRFGRVDVVADHDEHGLHLVEVEGHSRRQKELGLYSCLGQLLLIMRGWSPRLSYGLAVPDTRQWWKQLRKIPPVVTARLNLHLYSVGHGGITVHRPGEEVFIWDRG